MSVSPPASALRVTSDRSRTPELDPAIDDLIATISGALGVFARRAGVPDIVVTVVWAHSADFVAVVQDLLDEANGTRQQDFATERLGGGVWAKNITMSSDGSDVRVVFNADGASAESVPTAFLLAHELAHPLINRLLNVSGALDDVPEPSVTPVEVARSIARTAADEYRADRIAGAVVSALVSLSSSKDAEPYDASIIGGDSYWSQVGSVLDSHVWPGWPDAVVDYQWHRLALEDLYRRVMEDTDQTFTLLAHAQAFADMGASSPDPFEGLNGEHRGADLYLRAAWETLIAAVDQWSWLPDLDQMLASDKSIADAGQQALVAMWTTLGLTFDIDEDRTVSIRVDHPQR